MACMTTNINSQHAAVAPAYDKRAEAGCRTKEPLRGDVLLGRGTGPNEHHGNRVFRQLVRLHEDGYARATSAREKEIIVTDVIAAIQQKGGRFLRRVSLSKGRPGCRNSAYDYYEVVDTYTAMEKTKQAFQYCRRNAKKRAKHETDDAVPSSSASPVSRGSNPEGSKIWSPSAAAGTQPVAASTTRDQGSQDDAKIQQPPKTVVKISTDTTTVGFGQSKAPAPLTKIGGSSPQAVPGQTGTGSGLPPEKAEVANILAGLVGQGGSHAANPVTSLAVVSQHASVLLPPGYLPGDDAAVTNHLRTTDRGRRSISDQINVRRRRIIPSRGR